MLLSLREIHTDAFPLQRPERDRIRYDLLVGSGDEAAHSRGTRLYL